MAKLEIQDECLAPERYIYLTYTGPDPWGVVKKISDLIKPFFHVSASATAQERLNWDTTGDPITFWSLWWVKKGFSRFSGARFYLWVQGSKSKTDNTGQFTMRLHGNLETKVEGIGILIKPFWVLYSYLFYNRVRMKYIESCRNLLINFRNEIKEHYNLGITSGTGAHTVFG